MVLADYQEVISDWKSILLVTVSLMWSVWRIVRAIQNTDIERLRRGNQELQEECAKLRADHHGEVDKLREQYRKQVEDAKDDCRESRKEDRREFKEQISAAKAVCNLVDARFTELQRLHLTVCEERSALRARLDALIERGVIDDGDD